MDVIFHKIGKVGFLLFTGFFFSPFSYSQLPAFNLQVSAVSESCTANGILNFSVSDTAPGATVLYTIYHLPDTTLPLAVLNTNTFTGLVAGDYRVVATQSIGNQSSMEQQDINIASDIIDLAYIMTVNNEICGNDGKITVQIINSAAVSYEIISGPVIRPPQASNVFDDLPGGSYNIRVFDACGEGLVRTQVLLSTPPGVNFHYGSTDFADCQTFNVTNHIFNSQGHILAYPITIESTVYPPSGAPMIFSAIYNTGSSTAAFYSFNVPALLHQSYTYNVRVTDGCGNTYTQNNLTIAAPLVDLSAQVEPMGCAGYRLRFNLFNAVYPVSLNFTMSPSGFDPLAHNENHPGPFADSGSMVYYNENVLLPAGTYTVVGTDACGRSDTETFTIGMQPVAEVGYYMNPGCEAGKGSIKIEGQLPLIGGELIAAPPGYPFSLPQDLSNYLVDGGFQINSLMPGNYLFRTVDACNGVKTLTAIVIGYQSGPPSVTIFRNCDSFNLYFQNPTNSNSTEYWLQRFNPVTNLWVNPETGNSSPDNSFSGYNARQINYGNNANIHSSGTFRVVKIVRIFDNGPEPAPPCIEEIYNFEYSIGPRITDVYSFACENNRYTAIVIATGYAPLKYQITAKNNQPFIVDNQFSNVFLGLEPAVYGFQIEDGCGNILNSQFDISNPISFSITPTAFCNGQPASLSVPAFSFLSYQWWKGNDRQNILSIGNSLNFPSFSTANNGVYHVRVYHQGNPNSCIDLVMEYQISVNPLGPEAGTGQNVVYCGSQGTIDLFTLLSGNDTGGRWTEITGSGALTDHLWNSAAAGPGNYEFLYTVTGLCNASDQALVTVRVKPVPETPAASVGQAICDGRSLNLFAASVPFATYQWTGPNGFISNEQNPVIDAISGSDNGTYSVKAFLNGCGSAVSRVEVVVNPLPEFSLKSECINNVYSIKASQNGKPPNPETVSYTYTWTGPDNYTNSGNPIAIGGEKKGRYRATATSSEGCTFTSEIDIVTTHCNIPNIITPNNDNDNDVFDLTGMDVSTIEIYNRWGRIVYEQENYSKEWYGQNMHNQALPGSTYFYLLKLRSGEEKTGWVYVMK